LSELKEPLIPLTVALQQRGSRSLLSSLHAQLRTAILDGRLKPGLRLPSTRALARSHGVSRNTVVAAYDLLLSEGYVVARQGSGTLVAESVPASRRSARPKRASPSSRGIPAPSAPSLRYSFQLGVPDAGKFPYDVWRRMQAKSMKWFRHQPAQSDDPQGLYPLRQAIAQHVSFARAVACGPEDVLVTAGAQQAFDLLARTLTAPRRSVVAVENPGYPKLLTAFAGRATRIAAVAVDADGMIVDRVPAGARVICVTPSHQFPLGAVLSAQRRTQLLELAARRGAVIIEDDYDGEYRFVDRPLDSLQTLDRSQSVFYVGTFSKSLLPDLRIGYVVAPPWAMRALIEAKSRSDGYCSSMLQMSIASMILEGHLARHIRKMLRIYRQRRERLMQGLNGRLSQWLEPLPSMAGLHATARLNAGIDDRALAREAQNHGVGVTPLQRYYLGRPAMQGLVFGYGNLDESAIDEALRLLGRAFT
jgi:GntR family transcriptional regulator / MocR family aminotransferase